MKTVTFVTTLLLALAGPAAQAQQLRPGLWEHQMTMKTGSGELEAAMAQMQAQMAAMPPDKRKQIEEAMKAQGMATGMPGAGPGMSLKVCLTPEQAARNEVPQSDPDGQCKQTQMSRSGKTVKFKMECTGERKASGEGEFTLISDKEHQGRIRITSARKNRDETMEMQTRARWLTADCGDVKPRP